MSPDLVRRFSQRLGRTERLTPDELLAFRAPLITKLLVHARSNTDFYRERLHFDFNVPEKLEKIWSEIPILSRAQAVANWERLKSRMVPADSGPVIKGETSGSTGMALRFQTSGSSLTADQALTERMFRWWSVDGKKSMANIAYDKTGNAAPPHGRTTRGWHSARPNGMKYFLSHVVDIDRQLDWLVARKPNYLASYSSILKELAVTAPRRGIELKFDLIFPCGAVFDADTRAACRSAFGAESADTYGAQEVGHIAAQCPDCGEYHISAEASVVEVLRDNGSPAIPGETGRVIVTPLYNYAMPLVRYELGDMAEVGAATPSCGRRLGTLRRIRGRYRHLFRFRDGTKVWPFVANFCLSQFVPLRQYQVVQTDFDHIEIKYVPEPGSMDHPIDVEALTQRVRTVLGQPVEVAVHAVEAIERSRSGKFEDCISLVPWE
jgi:phenylacetate-CoA ligase